MTCPLHPKTVLFLWKCKEYLWNFQGTFALEIDKLWHNCTTDFFKSNGENITLFQAMPCLCTKWLIKSICQTFFNFQRAIALLDFLSYPWDSCSISCNNKKVKHLHRCWGVQKTAEPIENTGFFERWFSYTLTKKMKK